jgi:hypothetical protein
MHVGGRESPRRRGPAGQEIAVRWRIADLPPLAQDRLAEVSAQRGLRGSLCYFEDKNFAGLLGVLGLLGLAIASLGVKICSDFLREHWNVAATATAIALTALALVWSLLALLESLRSWSSPIKPFLLITPKAVLLSEHAAGTLRGYRMAEADDFRTIERYGSNQKYLGREYVVKFAEDSVNILARSRQRIELAEQVFARARSAAAEDDRALELLPAADLQCGPSRCRQITNPFGLFWVAVAGILCILILVAFVLRDITLRFLR